MVIYEAVVIEKQSDAPSSNIGGVRKNKIRLYVKMNFVALPIQRCYHKLEKETSFNEIFKYLLFKWYKLELMFYPKQDEDQDSKIIENNDRYHSTQNKAISKQASIIRFLGRSLVT